MRQAGRQADEQAGVAVRSWGPWEEGGPLGPPGPVLTWLCSQPVQGGPGLARSSWSSASQRRISCLSRSFSTISRSRCFSKSVPPCRVSPGGHVARAEQGKQGR